MSDDLAEAALTHEQRRTRRCNIAKTAEADGVESAAQKYGVSVTLAERACREFGVTARKAPRKQTTTTATTSLQIIACLQSGMRRPEIARQFNVSHQYVTEVYGKAKEAGISVDLSTLTAPTPVDWQPIETAPKDGTHVLVHRGRTTFVVYWDRDFDEWHLIFGPFLHSPTQWRPLPDPPTLPRPKPQ